MFKEVLIPLGVFFPVFGMLVMLGSSNAVNLTDGLDGLAIVPTIIAAGVFALIAYLVGNRIFADYLQLNPGARRGRARRVPAPRWSAPASGFLWFNAPPAAVFMGDTGSLALGGALGAVAVATKHEIVLLIVGGLFVLETVSVIIQVFWYKRTGRRVFLMAPLHHHFEKKGWAEPTIVIRFWIISMILALVGPRHAEDPMRGFPPDLFAGTALRRGGPRPQRPAGRAGARGDGRRRGGLGRHAGDPRRGGPPLACACAIRSPGTAFDFDALVLSPGIPHRFPRTASRRGARARRRACRSFPMPSCCSRRCAAAGSQGALRRHHRHQREVNDDSAVGACSSDGGRDRRRPAAISARRRSRCRCCPIRGVYVLEMSSYMLERIATLRFDVATMLNLSADHLDRHGGMAGYASAKRAIFAASGRGATSR